jgi:acyl-CoA thioester hydrolase
MSGVGWDLPSPWISRRVVAAAELDAYRHVNNAVYVTWLDHAAWEHAASLGAPLGLCLGIDQGMAVLRTVLSYQASAVAGDRIEVGTWIVGSDAKLRVRRRFQVRRERDAATLLRAEIEYVCIRLSSGRPTRMPEAFRAAFVVAPGIAGVVAALSPL